MKGINYSVITILLFSLFASCSGTQIGPRGVINDNVFTDEKHNLEFSIPEGWEIDVNGEYEKNTIFRMTKYGEGLIEFASTPLSSSQSFEDYYNEEYNAIILKNQLLNSVSFVGNNKVEIDDVNFRLISFDYNNKGIKLTLKKYYAQAGRDVITIEFRGIKKATKEVSLFLGTLDLSPITPAE